MDPAIIRLNSMSTTTPNYPISLWTLVQTMNGYILA